MEVENGDYSTPLLMACGCGNLPVVQLLCINGASRSPNRRGSPEECAQHECWVIQASPPFWCGYNIRADARHRCTTSPNHLRG